MKVLSQFCYFAYFIINLELCRFNHCGPYRLRQLLIQRKQQNLEHIKSLAGLCIRYKNRRPYKIMADDISIYGADRMFAYGHHHMSQFCSMLL